MKIHSDWFIFHPLLRGKFFVGIVVIGKFLQYPESLWQSLFWTKPSFSCLFQFKTLPVRSVLLEPEAELLNVFFLSKILFSSQFFFISCSDDRPGNLLVHSLGESWSVFLHWYLFFSWKKKATCFFSYNFSREVFLLSFIFNWYKHIFVFWLGFFWAKHKHQCY